MAEVQVQVSVPAEIQAACDGVVKVVVDIKAGAPIATTIGDLLPALVSAASNYSQYSADMKMADTVAYVGYSLAKGVAALLKLA